LLTAARLWAPCRAFSGCRRLHARATRWAAGALLALPMPGRMRARVRRIIDTQRRKWAADGGGGGGPRGGAAAAAAVTAPAESLE
jgi:hypothetical protein